jgi:hypothetical protein
VDEAEPVVEEGGQTKIDGVEFALGRTSFGAALCSQEGSSDGPA